MQLYSSEGEESGVRETWLDFLSSALRPESAYWFSQIAMLLLCTRYSWILCFRKSHQYYCSLTVFLLIVGSLENKYFRFGLGARYRHTILLLQICNSLLWQILSNYSKQRHAISRQYFEWKLDMEKLYAMMPCSSFPVLHLTFLLHTVISIWWIL